MSRLLNLLLSAIFKALGQISDADFRRVWARSLLWSIALSAGLVMFAGWALEATRLFGMSWLEGLSDALGWAAAFLLALLLFPVLVTVVVGFYLDRVAATIEVRHYSHLPGLPGQSALKAAMGAMRFAGLAIFLNIAVLPLYLVPMLNLFVFYGLNGYLLGQEYFALVAVRRLDDGAARTMRRECRGRIFAAGTLIAVILSVPVINVLMPVVATAFMVHIFESLRQGAQA